MFTIGAFARLGGVSVRTLRYYDEVGVLTPAATDPVTSYRYYRAQQLPRLHRVLALKALGLSLEQMGPLLDGALTAAVLAEMLAAKRAELAERVAEDQARLLLVEQRLRYIELEDDMSIDMVIKQIPALRVAQARWRGEEGIEFARMTEFAAAVGPRLGEVLRAAGLTATGRPFLHYDERGDGTLTPALAVPIGSQPFACDDDAVEVAELPAVEAVVTVHRGTGDHDLVGPLYGEMARYAEDRGYDARGPGRDLLVSVDGDELVIELQFPVAPSR